MSIAPLPHRFSISDYDQMIDLGILSGTDRVELIRGEIVEKMSIGEFHAACVRRLSRIFGLRLASRATLSIQSPVKLADSVPEPDVALLRPRDDDYASGHPTPGDIFLLVEVADTSLPFDRDVKCALYAENGVAEYWLLNLLERTLEVRRQPRPDGRYAQLQVLAIEDSVDIEQLRDATFTVGEFFPKA